MPNATVERDEWTPTFREYLKRWMDLSPTERGISIVVQNAIRANYATEGAHSGATWPRRTRLYPWPPLRRTQHMMRAQLAAAVQHWQSNGGSASMDFSEQINATPYSEYHHSGTRHMPARQTVRFSDEDIQQLETLLSEYLLKETA